MGERPTNPLLVESTSFSAFGPGPHALEVSNAPHKLCALFRSLEPLTVISSDLIRAHLVSVRSALTSRTHAAQSSAGDALRIHAYTSGILAYDKVALRTVLADFVLANPDPERPEPTERSTAHALQDTSSDRTCNHPVLYCTVFYCILRYCWK